MDGFDAGEDSNAKIDLLSDPSTEDALNTASAAADVSAHRTLMLHSMLVLSGPSRKNDITGRNRHPVELTLT